MVSVAQHVSPGKDLRQSFRSSPPSLQRRKMTGEGAVHSGNGWCFPSAKPMLFALLSPSFSSIRTKPRAWEMEGRTDNQGGYSGRVWTT